MTDPAQPRPDAADLDARIRQAEDALVARERRLVDRVDDLGRRARHALTPARMVLTAAGAAVVGGLLWFGFRRGAPAAAASAAPSPAGHAAARAAGAPIPWVGLLGLIWPMLPTRVRDRTSPATVAAVLGIAVPLMQKISARRQQPPLQTVQYVDLGRYAGDWYEVARLPAPFEAVCDGQPTAHYALAGGMVAVENRCPSVGGGCKSVHGVARVVPLSGNAKLEVNFLPEWLRWLPFGWADYQIVALDSDYRVALVGHPSREALWILSRTPAIEPQTLAALVAIAREEGFPVERLKMSAEG